MSASIRTYFHKDTSTFTHLILDENTRQAALVDPVLDFDQKAGRTSSLFVDQILADVQSQGGQLRYVLETHAHADHLSAGDYVRTHTGAAIVIGHRITGVQKTFAAVFNEGAGLAVDGRQFDQLVAEGDVIPLGDSAIQVLATPGHTPACVSYLLNNTDLFVGDTLFAPDVGSARCDFPGGDAGTLYDSVQRLLALGDEVMMHLCHDYPATSRELISQVSVGAQRSTNIHIRDGVSREDFVALREKRDAGLEMPRLIFPSLQVNIRAGALPEPEDNGISYLKMPLNQFP
ncbi:MBL fold metallo-hydrolase [Parathalassolituus penaei]|uniref:MBL fold metallo-hydrolase n=1 Tax=Parathalassolituus penaei TaxID=2997323 RepID=A0A9X3IR93_9GAMM|nr:MBL fold metallo-hydrolase [Parathalassolituus penaei]MCY0963594.1 MBL fold metallo-hydrolase [Parathalassolituus penaei]